ncbi:ameloblastin [Salmo trutta]|uniref:ameloblastin n=1 Tax=Salmo trutta TaxID=8032 RepID=UPI0011316499|nr:cyclin-dependent kinase inhibitor 1C-like [Salmo trutta]
MVTMKLLVLVMCLIGLCSSIPVSEEHDREERSASDEMFRGNGRGLGGFYRYQPPQYPSYFPSYFPYAQPPQSNSALMAILPLLLARLAATPAATPAAAPAPAPAPAAATPAPAAGGK